MDEIGEKNASGPGTIVGVGWDEVVGGGDGDAEGGDGTGGDVVVIMLVVEEGRAAQPGSGAERDQI